MGATSTETAARQRLLRESIPLPCFSIHVRGATNRFSGELARRFRHSAGDERVDPIDSTSTAAGSRRRDIGDADEKMRRAIINVGESVAPTGTKVDADEVAPCILLEVTGVPILHTAHERGIVGDARAAGIAITRQRQLSSRVVCSGIERRATAVSAVQIAARGVFRNRAVRWGKRPRDVSGDCRHITAAGKRGHVRDTRRPDQFVSHRIENELPAKDRRSEGHDDELASVIRGDRGDRAAVGLAGNRSTVVWRTVARSSAKAGERHTPPAASKGTARRALTSTIDVVRRTSIQGNRVRRCASIFRCSTGLRGAPIFRDTFVCGGYIESRRPCIRAGTRYRTAATRQPRGQDRKERDVTRRLSAP